MKKRLRKLRIPGEEEGEKKWQKKKTKIKICVAEYKKRKNDRKNEVVENKAKNE